PMSAALPAPASGERIEGASYSAAELIALRVRALLRRFAPAPPAADAALAIEPGEAACRHRLEGAEGAAWQRLLRLFPLAPAEADLLQFAVAAQADPELAAWLALAQGCDTRMLPGEPLVRALCGHPARPIWRPTGALSMWGLLTAVRRLPGEPLGFEADPRIVDWLFGSLSLDAPLLLAAERAGHRPRAPEWP